jgi:hypothetical protein
MDGELLRLVLLSTVGGIGSLWLFSTVVFRVSGTWERVPSEEGEEEGRRGERLTLAQLGPFVKGRRDVSGGYQEFSGLVVGRRVRLTRRDHGVKALLSQGFPENIAKQLDGEVMARMTLKLKDGGAFLDGAFEPQKIEFTHQPPRITSAHFLAPQPRTYRRVIPVHGEERIEAWADNLAEQSEAPV